MQFDYRERRLDTRNKVRRQPVGFYATGILAVVLILFVAGFATGWFACSHRMKQAALTLQPAAQQQATPVPSAQPQPPLPPGMPPLTFYETLPKGAPAVIGSGINASLKDQPAAPAHKPAPLPQAVPVHSPQPHQSPQQQEKAQPVPQAARPASPGATAQKSAESPAAGKPSAAQDGERRYSVQVASVKDRAEAESLRKKLSANGLNPMVVEVNVPDKGVVYRVRAGRRMLQREAQELAVRLGSGAMVVTE